MFGAMLYHEIFTLTLDSHVLLNINLFLQQNILTKTSHFMIPEGRDFDKDSKKSLFAFLGFFYDF